MPELGPSGSARGAVSNHRPYRDLMTVSVSLKANKSMLSPHIGDQISSRVVGDGRVSPRCAVRRCGNNAKNGAKI